jgi:hypothetical protein
VSRRSEQLEKERAGLVAAIAATSLDEASKRMLVATVQKLFELEVASLPRSV